MMSKFCSVALAALLASVLGACQTGGQSAQQMNKQYADSKVYIGALTCTVSGSTGFVVGSTKDLNCVYLTKDGVSQSYAGTIRKFGLDLGYTKEAHMIWHVFQLGGLVGSTLTTDPKVLTGGFIGEDASISAGASGGGNWLYGGANRQIVLQATDIQGGGAGYNLAYGVAHIELKLR
jgi:hypothetical protein